MKLELQSHDSAREPWVYCPNCMCHIRANVDLVARYLEAPEPWPCPDSQCKKGVDWFEAVCLAIKEDFFGQGARLLGAELAVFTIDWHEGEEISIDLTTHGIPSDATIASVVCGPNSPLAATDVAWNIPDKFRDPFKLKLFAVWFGDASVEAAKRSGKLTFLVTWLKHKAEGGWLHLAEAFRHYSASRYDAAIVPANTAVEMMLTPMLTKVVERFCASDKAKQFLTSDATYSHQLNILLPILCELYKAPKLPDVIKGQLNRLRDIRNQLAHRGHPKSPLVERETARLLAAAFFGVHYVQIVSLKFFPVPAETPQGK